jgi:hypothetical protein
VSRPMTETTLWRESWRADPRARVIADRHYNRQKVGSPQFVPPGRCKVLLTPNADALWVTSWPFAQYVKHAWAGAWVNSLFRNESECVASELITHALAATRHLFGDPPPLGIVSFVDPAHVKPTVRRGKSIFGYCYLKAGFKHVGFTKGGLWAWQLLPGDMPAPSAPSQSTDLAA